MLNVGGYLEKECFRFQPDELCNQQNQPGHDQPKTDKKLQKRMLCV